MCTKKTNCNNFCFRIWSNLGLESISTTGASIQLSENSNEAVIKTPDQASTNTFIRYVGGNLIFDDDQTVLGINGDEIEAYQKHHGTHFWKAEQVDTDATENSFTRTSIDIIPASGSWPFDCQKIIPCFELPMQTCGCDHYIKGDAKKVY